MTKSAYIVVGFDGYVDLPQELLKCKTKTLFRVAAVVQSTSEQESEWETSSQLLTELIESVAGIVKAQTILIEDHGHLFLSLKQYTASTVDCGKEMPPQYVRLFSAGKLVGMMATEYWIVTGGPFPYSDSLTFSFYLMEDCISEIVAQWSDIYNNFNLMTRDILKVARQAIQKKVLFLSINKQATYSTFITDVTT